MNRKQILIKIAKLNTEKKKLENEIKKLKKKVDLQENENIFVKFANNIIVKLYKVKSERDSFDTKTFKQKHPKLYKEFTTQKTIEYMDVRTVKNIKEGSEIIITKNKITI